MRQDVFEREGGLVGDVQERREIGGEERLGFRKSVGFSVCVSREFSGIAGGEDDGWTGLLGVPCDEDTADAERGGRGLAFSGFVDGEAQVFQVLIFRRHGG